MDFHLPKKKIFSAVLCGALMLSASVPAFAFSDSSIASSVFEETQMTVEQAAAAGNGADLSQSPYVLKRLGLVAGNDKGDLMLDKVGTRAEALTLFISMQGEQDEARAVDYSYPFTDIPDWFHWCAGYGVFRSYTSGISATKFGSFDTVTPEQYMTFTLKALDYKCGEDFTWDRSLDKAIEIGLCTRAQANAWKNGQFRRQEIMEISYLALHTKVKGGNSTLTDKLIAKGKITTEQQKHFMSNRELKVKFEIQNMFTSGNRATYGKLSTFCPILGEYDLINSIEKMLVTAQKLDESLHKIRDIDFSAFYREVQFSDPDKGINREMIMKEIMPDIILMPNAGTRSMMWQETAGVRRDTSARFLFPIFTAVDIDDMMVDTVGRYRWEICRKIQGVHWNDIREKSLTAEYCDYLQFYRKNRELSTEAKEKIKSALLRGRNNYREVFVKDYQNWMKYESKGSYRLNKIAREILITYCPFAKPIREELKGNPMYESALHRLDLLNAKTVQRIQGVYDKYQKAGGRITQELTDNLEYYEL